MLLKIRIVVFTFFVQKSIVYFLQGLSLIDEYANARMIVAFSFIDSWTFWFVLYIFWPLKVRPEYFSIDLNDLNANNRNRAQPVRNS
jgi:hypothetical protein